MTAAAASPTLSVSSQDCLDRPGSSFAKYRRTFARTRWCRPTLSWGGRASGTGGMDTTRNGTAKSSRGTGGLARLRVRQQAAQEPAWLRLRGMWRGAGTRPVRQPGEPSRRRSWPRASCTTRRTGATASTRARAKAKARARARATGGRREVCRLMEAVGQHFDAKKRISVRICIREVTAKPVQPGRQQRPTARRAPCTTTRSRAWCVAARARGKGLLATHTRVTTGPLSVACHSQDGRT